MPHLRLPGSLVVSDKLVHFAEYAVLGILLSRAIPTRSVRGWLALISIGAAIGFLDEKYQSIIPGRHTSVGDWLADSGGVCFGMVVWTVVARCRLLERRKGEYRSR